MVTHWLKPIWGGKGLFPFTVHQWGKLERSSSRNLKAGSEAKTSKEHCFQASSIASATFVSHPGPLVQGWQQNSGLGPPHQLSIKNRPHRHVYKSIWRRQFLNYFPTDSHLGHVHKTQLILQPELSFFYSKKRGEEKEANTKPDAQATHGLVKTSSVINFCVRLEQYPHLH